MWLGAISYSLYLWHALVLRAISPTAYRPLTFAVWLAATIVVSALSYRWIEQPFIRMGRSIAASPGHDRDSSGALSPSSDLTVSAPEEARSVSSAPNPAEAS